MSWLGKSDQAAPLLHRAIDIISDTSGPDDTAIAKPTYNLGIIHESLGNFREAQRLYEHSISVIERGMGTDHPLLGVNLIGLASLRRKV